VKVLTALIVNYVTLFIMPLPLFKQITFLLSVATLEQLPPDFGSEVAFVGRSNAGKSSAINAITGFKGLAKVSKTPGRTQCINLFTLSEQTRLADLPGYGYAAVPPAVKQRWQYTLSQYLLTRQCLKGLILVMDIRHPCKIGDEQLLGFAIKANLPTHILLTKADKLSRNLASQTLKQLQTQLLTLSPILSAQLFSATQGTGIDEASLKVQAWLKTIS
jgi:GTP-binding protein